METFELQGDYIKLGQLLKLLGIAQSGAHAKIIIANGEVLLNGKVVLERGKKIVKDDLIEIDSKKIQVT